MYAESIFDCVLGKKWKWLFVPFRPLIMIPSFFFLIWPLKRPVEVFQSFMNFEVNMCVHFMLSIRGVRFIVCWAYAEWGLLSAEKCEHTPSEIYRMLSIRGVRLMVHLVFFIHFMLSIRGVRFIVCWAYAESAKARISGPFQKQNKKVFKSSFILLLDIPN